MKNKIDYLKCRSIFIVVFVGFFLILASTAHATTYYSDYGISRTWNKTVTAGTHHFQVNAIAANKNTEWYVNGAYTGSAENDWSGDPLWPLNPSDPDYAKNITSNTVIKAIVYDRYWSYPPEETHTWNVTIADTTPPSTPSLLSPASNARITDTTPSFDWSDASDSGSGVQKYQLIVETDTLGLNKINIETASSNYTTPSAQALDAGGAGYDWRVRAQDNAGNWGLWTSNRRFYVDTPPDTIRPNNPYSFNSTPPINVWANFNTINVSWSGASDDRGLAGYYYAITNNSITSVDISDLYQSNSSGSSSTVGTGFADGSFWYFHIRYKDTSNNLASSTAHYGPFKIDKTIPSMPSLLSPDSNARITDTTPSFDWSDALDSGSGVQKYQLIVETDTLGIDKINIETVSSNYMTTSVQALDAGGAGYDWRVRAQDNAGNWGSWTSNRRFYVDDPPIDLAGITTFNVPTETQQIGSEQTVTVKVRNAGTTTRSFWVGLSFSGPETKSWPEGWLDIPPVETAVLVPGDIFTINFVFTLPEWLPEGSYDAVAAVWNGFNASATEYSRPDGVIFSVNGLMTEPRYAKQTKTSFIASSTGLNSDPFGLANDDPGGLFAGIPVKFRGGSGSNVFLDLPHNLNTGLVDANHNDQSLSNTSQRVMVLMHGWNPTGNADNYSIGAFAPLTNNLKTNLHDNWSLVTYHWENDADTGFLFGDRDATNNSEASQQRAESQQTIQIIDPLTVTVVGVVAYVSIKTNVESNATVAAYRGYMHGLVIGRKLVEQVGASNLQQVHLVAHSAGSWSAYAALRYLKDKIPGIEVQVTYLDPFIPAQTYMASLPGHQPRQAFSGGVLSSTKDYTAVTTAGAYKADAYWTLNDATEWGDMIVAYLADLNIPYVGGFVASLVDGLSSPTVIQSLNWDWSGITKTRIAQLDSVNSPTYLGHSGPVKYYADSVANPANVIFDGKAWNVALAHNYVPPPDCNDNDGDGYGSPGNAVCRNGSQADCNDSSSSINPGASEICGNGIDENCDGSDMSCPDICNDNDGDGYGSPGNAVCRNGSQADCNDSSSSINPGASDLNCNGVDEDCDGTADEHYVSSTTQCGIGVCANTGLLQCFSGNTVDSCNERIPTETPESTCDDNLDNDCDGYLDNFDSDCPIDLPWQSIIHAEGQDLGGVYQYDVTIGVDSAADTLSAPPSPPSYSVKMDLYDSNWTALSKDIRLYGETSYAWTLGIDPHGSIAPPTARTSTISWDPETFNTNLDWSYILKDGNGGVVVPDMRTTTSYDVTGGQAVQYFSIETGPETCVDMSLSAGWNLISLPVTPNDPNVAVLFPDALVAYGFNGTYQQALSLEPVKGYWIKVPSIRTYPVCGLNFINYSKTLTPGWHLMGAVNAMDVTPDTLPDGCISVMYGFNGAYYQAFDFDLKSGYWVKINEGCEFSVTAP